MVPKSGARSREIDDGAKMDCVCMYMCNFH